MAWAGLLREQQAAACVVGLDPGHDAQKHLQDLDLGKPDEQEKVANCRYIYHRQCIAEGREACRDEGEPLGVPLLPAGHGRNETMM